MVQASARPLPKFLAIQASELRISLTLSKINYLKNFMGFESREKKYDDYRSLIKEIKKHWTKIYENDPQSPYPEAWHGNEALSVKATMPSGDEVIVKIFYKSEYGKYGNFDDKFTALQRSIGIDNTQQIIAAFPEAGAMILKYIPGVALCDLPEKKPNLELSDECVKKFVSTVITLLNRGVGTDTTLGNLIYDSSSDTISIIDFYTEKKETTEKDHVFYLRKCAEAIVYYYEQSFKLDFNSAKTKTYEQFKRILKPDKIDDIFNQLYEC